MADLARDTSGDDQGSRGDRDYSRVVAPIWYPLADTLSPLMRTALTRTIEQELIPRLMLVQRATEGQSHQPVHQNVEVSFSYQDVEAFCGAIIRQPLPAARDYIDSLISKGMSTEDVIKTVLSSAARHLGLLWDSDRLSFVDVTVGLSRIQQLLRIHSPAFRSGSVAKGAGHRVLLAMVPGDQHTFGLSVVEEYFARAGWDVETVTSSTKSIILDRVHTGWFDVVGLSASGESSRDDIAALIALIRDASMNQQIHIVLGGFAVVSNPGLAIELGADSGACDAQEALTTLARESPAAQISG